MKHFITRLHYPHQNFLWMYYGTVRVLLKRQNSQNQNLIGMVLWKTLQLAADIQERVVPVITDSIIPA